MKLAIVFIMLAASAHASINANRLADAIYQAEGGSKAKVPYGILAVKVSGSNEARRVCIRTIRTAQKSFKGNNDTAFIRVLSQKYCPPQCDLKGNRNWIRNVTQIYNRNK